MGANGDRDWRGRWVVGLRIDIIVRMKPCTEENVTQRARAVGVRTPKVRPGRASAGVWNPVESFSRPFIGERSRHSIPHTVFYSLLIYNVAAVSWQSSGLLPHRFCDPQSPGGIWAQVTESKPSRPQASGLTSLANRPAATRLFPNNDPRWIPVSLRKVSDSTASPQRNRIWSARSLTTG